MIKYMYFLNQSYNNKISEYLIRYIKFGENNFIDYILYKVTITLFDC